MIEKDWVVRHRKYVEKQVGLENFLVVRPVLAVELRNKVSDPLESHVDGRLVLGNNGDL